MEAVREEVFGPVLTVQAFDDEAEGLALAASSLQPGRRRVHRRHQQGPASGARQAGTVWVNRYGRTADYVIPTGGYHSSGIGKDLGRQAVEANRRFKSVLVDFSN
jgi:aldehyde dehydrogenase (NAD+)